MTFICTCLIRRHVSRRLPRDNQRDWQQHTQLKSTGGNRMLIYLSGKNLPRIKLIRGKLFRDRFFAPYDCLLISVAYVTRHDTCCMTVDSYVSWHKSVAGNIFRMNKMYLQNNRSHDTVHVVMYESLFTHCFLEARERVIGKHVASDQGLHCLLTGFSIKNKIKATK